MEKRKLTFILIATCIVYLLVAFVSLPVRNFDSDSYRIIGALTLKGAPIYPDPAISRHPYLPFFLYVEAASLFLSNTLHLPQIVLLKMIFTLFHLSSVSALFILLKKNVQKTALYALNPVSLFVTAFHGQFDIIPVTLLLWAIVYLNKKCFSLTAILLSLAITIKTWPILFVYPYVRRMPKKYWPLLLVGGLGSILLYCLFFRSSPISLLRVLFVYQGVPGIWGVGTVLKLMGATKLISLIVKLCVLCILVISSVRVKKTSVVEELTYLLLLFFLITPGFGIQWFLWLTPFFSLSKKPFFSFLALPVGIGIIYAYASWIPNSVVSASMATLIIQLIYALIALYFILLHFFPKPSPT